MSEGRTTEFESGEGVSTDCALLVGSVEVCERCAGGGEWVGAERGQEGSGDSGWRKGGGDEGVYSTGGFILVKHKNSA